MMPRSTRLAALRALKYAIRNVETAEQEALLDEAAVSGASQWRTPYGTVSVAQRKETFTIDPKSFLAWVEAEHPTEVETVVRPAFVDHIKALLTVVDGKVIRKDTGEVVPWAAVKPGGDRYVSIRGPEKDTAVEAATALVRGHVDELAAEIGQIES